MTFAEKLRLLRIKHGLTKVQVANEIGVTKASIGTWENGKADIDNIRVGNMLALCNLFKVPTDYFLSDDVQFINKEFEDMQLDKFDDMMAKSINYVLDNTDGLSSYSKTVASQLLYNKVKSKRIILKSDLEEVLKLLS